MRWIETLPEGASRRFTLILGVKHSPLTDLAETVNALAKVRCLRLQDSSMRAVRYNLELTVRFRPTGEAAWRDGTTQNVSASGVLFHAMTPLAADTRVELRLALPTDPAPEAFAEVICNGHIVRTAPSPVEGRTGLAVAISDYTLVRRETIES